MASGNEAASAAAAGFGTPQEYRAAFEQSRDAIMILGSEGFRNANPAMLSLFGVDDLTTLRSLHPGDLSPPRQPDGRSSRRAANSRINEALSHGRAFFEWLHCTVDGSAFPTEVLLSRIDLPRGPILQGVIRDISERKEAEAALRAREQELAEAQRLAQLGSWVFYCRNAELRWSDEVYRIFGVDTATWDGSHDAFMQMVHPDDRDTVEAALARAYHGEPFDLVHRIQRPDGEVRTVHARGHTTFADDGDPDRMVGTVQDITRQEQLERNQERLAAVLDSTSDYVATHDADGQLLYINAAGRRSMGIPLPSSETEWRPDLGWDYSSLPPEMTRLDTAIAWAHPQWAADKIRNQGLPTAMKHGVWQGESALLPPHGEEIPVSQVIIVHRDETGAISQFSTIMHDISEHKRLEIALQQEATTDRLTGLYNRLRFDVALGESLAHQRRYGREASLIMIDLDHFKRVNDNFGHDTGDQVLVELARRLQQACREPDFLARWGGEEFVILMPGTAAADAVEAAERLRHDVAQEPFAGIGTITISAGVTGFVAGDNSNTLFKRVDKALYAAKAGGRNRVALSEPGDEDVT